MVLAEAGGVMRLRDVHVGVERKLGGAVSLYSVADFLVRRSKGGKPLFVHTGYGRYRLADEPPSVRRRRPHPT